MNATLTTTIIDLAWTGNQDQHISSVYSRHLCWGGGGGNFIPAPQKTYNSPQTAAKLSALNLFFRLETFKNFLLVENKHRKLFVRKQSKGCKFMSTMHQNMFGGRALPRLAGGAYVNTQLQWGVLRVRGGKGGQGAYF